MVLFLIGLGLGNIKDITVKGIFSGYACAANCKHKGLITKSSGWDIHSDIFDKLLIKTLITFDPSSRMPSECTVLLVLFYRRKCIDSFRTLAHFELELRN